MIQTCPFISGEVSDVFFNSKRVPEGEERCRKKAQSTEAPGPELRREQVSMCFFLIERER